MLNSSSTQAWEISEIFVQKRQHIVDLWKHLQTSLEWNLGLKNLWEIHVYEHYIVSDLSDDELSLAKSTVFSEAPVDILLSREDIEKGSRENTVVIESQAGQFDVRVQAVKDNLTLQTGKDHHVRVKQVIQFSRDLSRDERKKITGFLINPNEKQESSLSDIRLERSLQEPENHILLTGFRDISDDAGFQKCIQDHELSLSVDDIRLVHGYFLKDEQRDPTKAEILLIDTYWSDHCRHSTFFTQMNDVHLCENKSATQQSLIQAHKTFEEKSTQHGKPWNTLMELATWSARFLWDDHEFQGVDALDLSLEDNAASYKTPINFSDGSSEDWIIMFKNETHNSPTETEPFWGAATCLWWAIRDTLSGRSFTFWAMRVSGAKNPTEPISETLSEKLSQRAISIGAMLGYSSYGNQIGLATGRVREFFHPGYAAKRFECGYVLAAVKEEDLVRESPKHWDKIIVFWWATGRDGVWGASTSSKSSWEVSHETLGAHVQKWNPVEERKMQRLMLNSAFTKKVKKSNDFWAGGVSVALWEIAEGVHIFLDEVAKHVKYQWLSDIELLLSESQERMAIIVSADECDEVLDMIRAENIHGFVAGEVMSQWKASREERLRISYQWKDTVNLSRKFLSTNGAPRSAQAKIDIKGDVLFFYPPVYAKQQDVSHAKILKKHLGVLSHASQKWLHGNFDNSVWASTILAPYGWKYQNSPQVWMVSKIPSFDGRESLTGIASTFSYNPKLLSENSYVWWIYTIIESLSKIVALWGDHQKTWLSLQEYFWKLTDDEKWGEVYAWLLGTLEALLKLKVAAIGGKDSMSGTHIGKNGERIDVPPTIVSFANCPLETKNVVSAELKQPGNAILHFPIPKLQGSLPDFDAYKQMLITIQKLISSGCIFSSSVVEESGVYGAIVNMSLGNKIGVHFEKYDDTLYAPLLWDIVLEVSPQTVQEQWLETYQIAKTQENPFLTWKDQTENLSLDEAHNILRSALENVFPSENTNTLLQGESVIHRYQQRVQLDTSEILSCKPKALITVFPGTNSELDTRHALMQAGFEVEEFVFQTLHGVENFQRSRKTFADKLSSTHLLVFPWGFSNGDEPDGSAKYIANIMRSSEIRESFQAFLEKKWTVTLGICNGFQALIKLWVFENGKVKDYLTHSDETLTFNSSMRHQTELVKLEIRSLLSPAMSQVHLQEYYTIPISHGEWRVVIPQQRFDQYSQQWQIPMIYVDYRGNPTDEYNGSDHAIAGLTSPDGRILWMMPHPERKGENVFRNIPWEKHFPLFEGIFHSMKGN